MILLPILRVNPGSFSASPPGGSAPRTFQNPLFSEGIQMLLLPLLRLNLSSFSASPPGGSAPRTPRINHFPRNFNDFPSLPEAQLKLMFCEPAWWLSPPGPPESIIFLRNSNAFAPLTEAQLKLIFCESAWSLSPQGL